MASYFDRQGNIYQIEDQKILKKKDRIDVWSETGEEYSIPAEAADEHRLTEDERARTFAEILTRVATLLRVVGVGPAVGTGGCPNIDPPSLGSVLGTLGQVAAAQQAMPQQAMPQQQAAAFQAGFGGLGGGCPVIDPVSLGALLGTRVLPQQNQWLGNVLRAALGGCPNIDAPGLGNFVGNVAQPANLQAAGLERIASGGCPNIDPVNLATIAGLASQLAARRPGNWLDQVYGGGCPAIDPVQLGSLLGTLGALRGGRF